MVRIDWEALTKRLLVLGQLGCRLESDSGHIWIEQDRELDYEEYRLYGILKKGGVRLNNKIYGGILEALDTIDECLKRCGEDTLLEKYDEDELFLGNKFGPDFSRINVVDKNEGGLE